VVDDDSASLLSSFFSLGILDSSFRNDEDTCSCSSDDEDMAEGEELSLSL
jgi:hypothetical protein